MTMINNKERAICFSHATLVRENKTVKDLHTAFTYSPEMPVIICSNKKEAEEIQQQINTFVRNFSQKLLDREV